jgi:hypothetical protein
VGNKNNRGGYFDLFSKLFLEWLLAGGIISLIFEGDKPFIVGVVKLLDKSTF